MSTPEGFELDLHTLELFYRVCRRYKVPDDAKEIKIWLMRELVRKKKAKYIPHPAEYLKNKRVLRVKKDVPNA